MLALMSLELTGKSAEIFACIKKSNKDRNSGPRFGQGYSAFPSYVQI